MFRAIKIKLYPNKQQEQVINKILGCYRFVYNHMLADYPPMDDRSIRNNRCTKK